jgi:hypothetical protein
LFGVGRERKFYRHNIKEQGATEMFCDSEACHLPARKLRRGKLTTGDNL